MIVTYLMLMQREIFHAHLTPNTNFMVISLTQHDYGPTVIFPCTCVTPDSNLTKISHSCLTSDTLFW